MGITLALKRNGRDVFFNNPGPYYGATSLQTGNFIKGGLRNRNAGAFNHLFGGYPNGALAPSAFILPEKTGSISSYTRSRTSINVASADLIPALPMIANGTLTLTVTNAQLDQVIQAIASATLALTGSASLAAAISAAANSTMVLSGTAQLGGIVPITGSGTFALTPAVTLNALAYMEAEAGGPTPLSPEGLANAVLDALLADHTISGSVGEALNNVGASSNPWSSDLASNNDPGTFGKRIQELLTTTKFLGLK